MKKAYHAHARQAAQKAARPKKTRGKLTPEKVVERLKKAPRVHITHGNGKTEIDAFNLLAGDGAAHSYDGTMPAVIKDAAPEFVAACRGTCGAGCDCSGCYAKNTTRYPDAFFNYAENTFLAFSAPAATVAAVEKEVFGNGNAPALFRIHDSGDFFSLEYFAAWMECIKRHPATSFGAYTKRADIVNAYGIENLPENLSLLCSPWEGFCEPIGDLPQFIYDDGTNPELAGVSHCPAVDKDGKRTGITCKMCGYCYHAKRGTRRAVYAH